MPRDEEPLGFQNSATVRSAAGWSGRGGESAAAVRAASVVVGLVLGGDHAQMLLAEDQHPVCDLPSNGEDEALRMGVRAGASGWDLHRLDAGVGWYGSRQWGCDLLDHRSGVSGLRWAAAS